MYKINGKHHTNNTFFIALDALKSYISSKTLIHLIQYKQKGA